MVFLKLPDDMQQSYVLNALCDFFINFIFATRSN